MDVSVNRRIERSASLTEGRLINYQIKEKLQNTSILINPGSGYGYWDDGCWGHPCWCERTGSGRIDALNCIQLRYFRPCPTYRETRPMDGFPSPGNNYDYIGTTIEIFDLSGRKIDTISISRTDYTQSEILSYFRKNNIPSGAKVLRIKSANSTKTWRIVN